MGCNCKKNKNGAKTDDTSSDSVNDSPFDSYKDKPLLARLGLFSVKILSLIHI